MIYHIVVRQGDSTALIRATLTGHAATVALLLDRGASIDLADKVDRCIACEYCVVENMLER